MLDAVNEKAIFDDEIDKSNGFTNDEDRRERSSETSTQNKGKRTKLEKIVEEMKKTTDEKMKRHIICGSILHKAVITRTNDVANKDFAISNPIQHRSLHQHCCNVTILLTAV